MTRDITDNFSGLTCEEDEGITFVFVKRRTNGLFKWEGDVEEGFFNQKVLGEMVRKPKMQRWHKLTEEEKVDPQYKGLKGYWEKV
jgi:hypothetical protein